jgi:hypothetical protein
MSRVVLFITNSYMRLWMLPNIAATKIVKFHVPPAGETTQMLVEVAILALDIFRFLWDSCSHVEAPDAGLVRTYHPI